GARWTGKPERARRPDGIRVNGGKEERIPQEGCEGLCEWVARPSSATPKLGKGGSRVRLSGSDFRRLAETIFSCLVIATLDKGLQDKASEFVEKGAEMKLCLCENVNRMEPTRDAATTLVAAVADRGHCFGRHRSQGRVEQFPNVINVVARHGDRT